jgi:hypothetical protein
MAKPTVVPMLHFYLTVPAPTSPEKQKSHENTLRNTQEFELKALKVAQNPAQLAAILALSTPWRR